MEGEQLRKGADALTTGGLKRKKTETEMGGLCEERFGGSWKGVENESEGWGSGDSSKTGTV